MSASDTSPLLTNNNLARSRPTVAFWAVFAWLAIQVLALLAAGFRVPLSARFPSPEEHLAMHEMLIAQMVGSALLFPILMQCFSTAVLVIAAAPVMMLLAGLLAEAPAGWPLIWDCVYPAVWLVGLAFWASILKTPKARLYGISVAVLFVLGGALLAYLDREFGAPTETFSWQAHGYLGPVMGGMAVLESGAGAGTIWIFLGMVVICGAIGAFIRRARTSKAKSAR